MKKGRGKGTDTLQTDNVFTRNDYIEREAALAFPFANGRYDHKNADPHFINGCETYKEWLGTIPAADVVPVRHGQLESSRPDAPMFGFHFCSICGRKRTSPQDNYCPDCGARMEG